MADLLLPRPPENWGSNDHQDKESNLVSAAIVAYMKDWFNLILVEYSDMSKEGVHRLPLNYVLRDFLKASLYTDINQLNVLAADSENFIFKDPKIFALVKLREISQLYLFFIDNNYVEAQSPDNPDLIFLQAVERNGGEGFFALIDAEIQTCSTYQRYEPVMWHFYSNVVSQLEQFSNFFRGLSD